MIRIQISNVIREKFPELKVATIECRIDNSEYSWDLWEEIKEFTDSFVSQYQLRGY